MRPQRQFNRFFAGLFLFALPMLTRADSVSMNASEDSFVDDGCVICNNGANPSLAAGATENGIVRRALYKFDLTGKLPVNATITSVTLSLQATKNPSGGGADSTFDLRLVQGSWSEGSVTWASMPTFSSAARASLPVSGTGTYVFGSTPEMVADVQGWLANSSSSFGWILMSEDESTPGTARRWGARESGTPPNLVIQYTAGTPPPTPPTITQPAKPGTTFQFSFAAEAGRTYAAEMRGALGGTNWTVVTNIPSSSVATNVVVTDTLTSTQRFYRVRTP